MVRITPQDLQGSPVSRAVASPTDQFGLRGPGGPGDSPLPPQLIEFAGLSQTLARIGRARRDADDELLQEVGAEVASLQEQGLEEEEILKQVIKAGVTPKRIAALLRNSSLEEVDNPAFQLGLQSRRAESKVLLYESAAKDSVDSLAKALQGASTPQERMRIREDALKSLREANEEVLAGIGPLGRSAAERMLSDVHARFLTAADEQSRVAQAKEYRKLLSERVVRGADQMIESRRADGTIPAGEQDKFVKGIGAAYDQARLDGSKTALEDTYLAAQAAVTRVAQDSGAKQALEVAQEILYDTQDGNRDRIFDNDPDIFLRFNQRIAELERQAEREEERKDYKLNQQKTEVANTIANSQAIVQVLSAETPEEATIMMDNLIQNVAKADETTLEALGIDEGSIGFAVGALRAEKSVLISQARGEIGFTKSQEDLKSEVVIREIIGNVWNTGEMPSFQEYSQLPAERRRQVQDEARAILENDIVDAYRRASENGTLQRTLHQIAKEGATRDPQTGEPIGQSELENFEELDSYIRERLRTDEDFAAQMRTNPSQALKDIRSELQELVPSTAVTEGGTTISDIVGEEEAGTTEGVVAASTFEINSTSAPARISPSTTILFGGVMRAGADPKLVTATEYILKRKDPYPKPSAETFGGQGFAMIDPLDRTLKQVEKLQEVEGLDLDAAYTEVLMMSGVMRLEDFNSETPQLMLANMDERLGRTGEVVKRSLSTSMSDIEELDMVNINPFAVKFEDLSGPEVQGWFRKEGDVFTATDKIPATKRRQIETFLRMADTPVTDLTIGTFLFHQQANWNR